MNPYDPLGHCGTAEQMRFQTFNGPHQRSSSFVKKTTTRKARFVTDKIRGNSFPGQIGQYSGCISQPTTSIGRIQGDRIIFALPPKMPRVICPFSFAHTSEYHVVIYVDPPNVEIPFSVNEIPFHHSGAPVDVTSQLKIGQNYIIFNTLSLSHEVVAGIQWKLPSNLMPFVQKIINERDPYEVQAMNCVVSRICPISKEPMNYPGRGQCCDHSQCFDLYAFLKRARETNDWSCPICGKRMDFSMLRHDPSFIEATDPQPFYDDFNDNFITESFF